MLLALSALGVLFMLWDLHTICGVLEKPSGALAAYA
jgi:hypothetical protein